MMDGLGALAVTGDSGYLVRAASAGDADAFDRLVETYAGQVFRLALRMLGNRQDAEDVQQDTFVKAFRSLRGFRGESSFGTWICAIAARNCLVKLRRRSRRFEQSGAEAAVAVEPQGANASWEAATRVQQTLAALSAPDRLLIVLKYVEQFSHDEIAHILGCTPQSSRSRLLRAKRLFRERYQGMEP